MLAINLEDVVNVLNAVKPYLIALAAALVLTLVVIAAAGRLPRPRRFLVRGQAGLALALATAVIVNLICFGPMSTMIALATGSGSISGETAEQAKQLCQEIAREGIVLLKNEDGALPLPEGAKLNVFGWSSTNPVYGGTGSGGLSEAYPTVSLLEGLERAGFQLNAELARFYSGYRAARPTVGMWGQDWTIPEPSMADYEAQGVFAQAKEFSDTALIVIARSGGEGADLPRSIGSEDTFEEGGTFGSSGLRYTSQPDDRDADRTYLELSHREQAMVERVCAEFDKVVVIVNSSNAMELGWLEQYGSIQAALLVPGPGQTGFNALGEILRGSVNPSGKTADTFLYDLTDAPTWNNFGAFPYDNMGQFAVDGVTPSFVNYVEGIYVGYRFYETAAAEGLIDYAATVQYPFGYGLSYTSFTQEMGDVREEDGTLTFPVTVTNTGAAAGKEVVQVYCDPPYVNGGVEKASANLVFFAKTGLLQPGQAQTLSVSLPVEDLASYDERGAGRYVLQAGDYVLSVNADSHTPLDSRTYAAPAAVTYGENNPRSHDEAAAVNRFGDARGDTVYLSRAGGFSNYAAATAAPARFTLDEEHKAAFVNNANYDPAAHNDPGDVMPATGVKNGLELASFRGLSYDDPQWEPLLDQLTASDMDALIALAGYQTGAVSSVGKLATVDCDGPASINNNFTKVGSIGFPAAVMIACTWNGDLALAFGQSIGRMADEMGVSGWYAPAMNIHRSAFSGRNFEYYSEDPYLSGILAAQAVRGAREYGVYAYLKHFALNDQETARTEMLCTWSNEQAIREIYLKPFELSVKEGGAQAVMSSFNYIGVTWAGAYAPLLQAVLREEWGFRGFVLTDYFGVYGYMNADQAIRNGTDAMLVAYDTQTNHVSDTASATGVLAMRRSCKNILYTVVNSRAYEPENIQTGLLPWQIAAVAIDAALAAALVLGSLAVWKKSRALERSQRPGGGQA